MNHIDLDNLFTYHAPVGDQPQRYTRLRAAARAHAAEVVALTPPCADQSAAIRLIREASFTANAAIACSPPESAPPMPPVVDPDEAIARIAHEANRAICESVNDHSQKPWDETPDNIRASTLLIVRECRADPNYSPSTSHERWLEHRRGDGWTWGPTKDSDKKTNPAMVPFSELPVEQRAKAYVFVAIVRAAVASSESVSPMPAATN